MSYAFYFVYMYSNGNACWKTKSRIEWEYKRHETGTLIRTHYHWTHVKKMDCTFANCCLTYDLTHSGWNGIAPEPMDAENYRNYEPTSLEMNNVVSAIWLFF